MSYWAVGHGSLTLRVDEQSVSDLRTRMRTHYDKLCQEAQKSAEENSLKESISQKYQTEKQMLGDSEPSKWLQRELREAGFSGIYFENMQDSQCLHIETSFDAKYYEDRIMPLLEILSPHTVEGEFSFQGVDDALWRLLFTDTGWIEQSGEIVYTDTPSEGSRQALSVPANTEFIAVYLEWDELERQLDALVQQLLSVSCKVSIKRVEYYFWEMLLNIHSAIDEKQSAEICERLHLQNITTDHFMDNASVDNNQMLPLLGLLTNREVTSSHADDYGIWIICKNTQAASPENTVKNQNTAESDIQKPLPTPETVQRAKQCLIDNGIAPDRAGTVLQTLGYILLDADILQPTEEKSAGNECGQTNSSILAYYKNQQRLYVMKNGGYGELREADDTYNDLNRHIIDAYRKVHGKAFLGSINLSAEKRAQLENGPSRVFEEYTGQCIYNFSCDFVVPTADKELEQLILAWNRRERMKINKITEAIDHLGGIHLIWY